MPQPAANRLVVVALGSNQGDSRSLLQAAAARLQEFANGPLQASSLWRSAPVDCPPESPGFINAVVIFEAPAEATPESLLDRLQELEREFGREPKRILNEPRPLDLDLIAFGRQTRASPGLTLPHPRAHHRRFVLAPLAEIAPTLRLPGQRATIQELLATLPEGEAVSRWADPRWTGPGSAGPGPVRASMDAQR